MITLRTTVIGRAQLNAALAGDGPAPVLASMVIGSDAPPDPATTSASNLTPVQPAAQLVIARHTADIISGSAGFDAPASADVITWLALLYADGTPAAVGAIDGGLPRIPGLRLELTWAWASTDSGDLALDISIIDINALREQLYHAVRADLDDNNLGIAETRIKPVERAMQHVLRDGNPLMQIELFADPYNLRGGPALAISGVIAGDDSIDLAEHTETLLSGDYLIFGGGNTETVRLLANLELGRRRLQSDILHTYPTATLSRTNWAITPGEAIAGAGQQYYSQPLVLDATANRHRVLVRALTASGAPVVAVRTDDDSDYQAGVLERTRPAADGRAGWSDYIYGIDIDAPDVDGEMHLRVTTPVATRISMISAISDYVHRFALAPVVMIRTAAGAAPNNPRPGDKLRVDIIFNSDPFFQRCLLWYNNRSITLPPPVYQSSGNSSGAGGIWVYEYQNVSVTVDDADEHVFAAIGVNQMNSRTAVARTVIGGASELHTYTESGSVTVPAGVTSVVVTGKGSAGSIREYRLTSVMDDATGSSTAGSVNEYVVYENSPGAVSGNLSNGYPITLNRIRAGEYLQMAAGSPAIRAIYGNIVGGGAGAAATVASVGAHMITLSFPGGAENGGAATARTEIIRLPGDEPETLVFTVPAGGSVTIRW